MVSTKKSVRFSKEDKFCFDTSRHDKGCRPSAVLWYKAEDFEAFRADERGMISEFLSRSRAGENLNSSGYYTDPCLRGLEKLSRSSNPRNSLVKAVLDLQKEHRASEISDPKGVSMISKVLSKSDRKLAALFGSVDRQEALRVWKDVGKGSCEDVSSEYFQLSVAVIDQSTDAAVLLNGGMRYFPRPDNRKMMEHEQPVGTPTNTEECRQLQLCVVRRRVGETPSIGSLGSRAA